MVENLIAQQGEPSRAQRLAQAFTALLDGIHFVPHRATRAKFRNNFEKFILEVRTILVIK